MFLRSLNMCDLFFFMLLLVSPIRSTLTPEQQLQLQSQQQGTTLQGGATHHPPGGATLQHPSASRASNMPQVSLPTSTPDPATSVERPEFNRSTSHNAAQIGNAAVRSCKVVSNHHSEVDVHMHCYDCIHSGCCCT